MNLSQPLIASASPGTDARLSALQALVHTLDKHKPFEGAWAQDRHFAGMSPSDRAFAQLLAKTVLRRLGQIDALLGSCLERPLGARFSRVMHILRLGVAQLLWLETPPHAAVHSAVEMSKQLKLDKHSGLINAVLKRISTSGAALPAAQDAERLNTPDWLWTSWEGAYGADTTQRIAHAHLQEPPLDISVKADPDLWAERLSGQCIANSVRLREARHLTRLPGFQEGEWWVQDVAAGLPARLLAPIPGQRVLDICAAPGGKTAQLCAMGAQVTAVELSKERVLTLKANLKRLRLHAEIITADATSWQPSFIPDAILLDAPCSATGTLRRHPDVAYARQPGDIARLMMTQAALLRRTLSWLAPDGMLVYAVCSLQPEEGEGQISRLLEEGKDVTLQPADAAALGIPAECITATGEIRTLPCHLAELGGMDGFYVAKLKKL